MKHIKAYEHKRDITNQYHISTLLEHGDDKVFIIYLTNDDRSGYYGDSYKFEILYTYDYSTDYFVKHNNKINHLRKSRFDDNILYSFDNITDALKKLNENINEYKMKNAANKYNL